MTRREQIERMLEKDPEDAFLRYGLAMECAKDGELAEALDRLKQLIADRGDYVPAYFQAGQLLVQTHRFAEAREMLRGGIAAAREGGDAHAAEEMAALLAEVPEE